MDELATALAKLLSADGVTSITLGPIEEDGSLGITVSWIASVGADYMMMKHLTAADSIAELAARINEIVDDDELDPR